MQRRLTGLFVLALFVIPGCAPQLIKKVQPDAYIASLDENVMVFGHISGFENGEEKGIYF